MKIKKGDKVSMIKGKDRGKSAKVLKVMPKDGRIVVDGLNLSKKSIRPKKQGEKGQIIEAPSAVKVENVLLVCPSCGKKVRVGYAGEGEKKVRVCKKCKATV